MNKLIKILNLLEQIDEQERQILENITILDEKRSPNCFIFSLLLKEPLPVDLFLKIKEIKYDEITIKTKIIKIDKITNNDVKKYLNHIANDNMDLINFKNIIDKNYFDFIHDARLIEFKYVLESEKDEINIVLKPIIDLLTEAFGLCQLSFEINQDTDFFDRLEEKQNEIKEKNKQVIKQYKTKIENEKETSGTKKTYSNQTNAFKGNFRPLDQTKAIELNHLISGMNNVNVQGMIFKKEIKELPKAKVTKLFITDYQDSFILKFLDFGNNNANAKKLEEKINELNQNDWITACVDVKSDNFEPEIYGTIKNIEKIEIPAKFNRTDDAQNKRIELTAHTKMTSYDGIIEVDELVGLAKKFKWPAVTCTDRFNIQSFPEFQKECTKANIKPIYGVEMNVLGSTKIVLNPSCKPLDDFEYVVFDLETTGLYPNLDDIIEFGGIKYKNGIQVDSLQFFIKPEKPISDFTTELTGITNDHLEGAISQEEGIKKILGFIGDNALIAHNAINFDFRFLCAKAMKHLGMNLTNTVIDSLHIVRAIYPSWKSHTLQKTCKEFKIEYGEDQAHRADYDAMVLNNCWKIILSKLLELNIKTIDEINLKLDSPRLKGMYHSDYCYIYPKNNEGLKKVNELVSISHTDNYYLEPKILYETLEMNRQNLIIAPSPIDGEINYLALNGTDDELKKAIIKYDYIFIAPTSNYLPFMQKSEMSKPQIETVLKKIIKFSKELNKKVIAVSDAYYLNSWEKKYQEVYLYAKALNGRRHRYYKYKTLPEQYVRSTPQMLSEFNFLQDENLINEIVIDNCSSFIESINDDIKPIKDGLFAPKMDNVDELLKTNVYETAHKIYGEKLPKIVSDRLEKELKSIISNGFSVVYWISHLLVKKSYDDGYSVGSRGSVGSSLVATMLKITDVNPLPPHYICNKCKYTEFVDNVDDGFDLIPCKCSKCDDGVMYGEGHDIPFETFLGFKGDKVPDIDLNFSGVYQPKAHNFIKEIFGEKHAFRAGTISKVAEKTCYGIVREYFNEIQAETVKNSTVDFIVKKCENVKRTTGQHPGGILVIPKEYSVFDFTPYNYPADDQNSDWYTTHYAFEFLHDNLLKFDILGHDNPTILRMLKDLTGIDESEIPNYDSNVIKMFSSPEPLKIDDNQVLNAKNGAITIPEFGTKFVREMLDDTKPQTFSDLIRISGLSHGTDVYLGNAKDLIKKQGLKLKDVIACRDDIMIYLIHKGVDSSTSFKIMEDVRKGKKVKEEYQKIMLEHNVPQWYIDSCNKIQYMFPKAHACAYVMHAWKFAWYKLYHPLAYYSVFLSIKSDSMEIDIISRGKESIKNRIDKINSLMNSKSGSTELKKKEIDSLSILEVCLEMACRGIKIRKPDIFLSDATKFIILNNELVAPFNCVDGIGDDVAISVIEARDTKPFVSVEDVVKRTKLNKTNIAKLEELGAFENLPKTGQMSIFD